MIYRTILLAVFFTWTAEGLDCVPRQFEYDSIVCVCNATYCDSTPDMPAPEKGNFNWYVSSRDGRRMTFATGKFAADSSNPSGINITVDRAKTYQPIYGFGGAFTDSAGMNIRSLSKSTQQILMQSYFGQDGSRYNLGRVPIGSSDFSVRFYTYDDVVNDTTLKNFQLAKEDSQYKLPYMIRAQELSPDLKILASMWSPPLWMKTNYSISGPSVLKKEFYQLLADYIMRFLRAYKSNGVEIWGVTTGNEPTNAFIPSVKIPCMGWAPYELGDWLANNLGPSIVNSELNDTYILAFDDQKFTLTWYMNMTMSNKAALDFVDGVAVHWYLDGYISAGIMDQAHNSFPSLFLLMTEACIGSDANDYPKVQLGSWIRAERYILDMIENLRHWITGWIDWNLALDKKGGPNWVDNYVDSSVIVNPETDEFFKQPMYYMIKHFSRFVERYSLRIDSSETDDVKSVAFRTPSKTIVVVLYNRGSKDCNVAIIDSKSGTIKVNLAPHSLHTIEYK